MSRILPAARAVIDARIASFRTEVADVRLALERRLAVLRAEWEQGPAEAEPLAPLVRHHGFELVDIEIIALLLAVEDDRRRLRALAVPDGGDLSPSVIAAVLGGDGDPALVLARLGPTSPLRSARWVECLLDPDPGALAPLRLAAPLSRALRGGPPASLAGSAAVVVEESRGKGAGIGAEARLWTVRIESAVIEDLGASWVRVGFAAVQSAFLLGADVELRGRHNGWPESAGPVRRLAEVLGVNIDGPGRAGPIPTSVRYEGAQQAEPTDSRAPSAAEARRKHGGSPGRPG